MPINENKLQELQSHHNNTSQSTPNSVPRAASQQQLSGTYEEILLDNNKLLRKLVRHNRWVAFFSLVKLMFFIVIPSYYAYQNRAIIEDYINIALSSVKTLQATTEQLKNPLGGIDINSIIEGAIIPKK